MDENLAKYSPYLSEVRKRLFFVASVFAISATLGFLFYEKIIRAVVDLFRLEGVNIVFTSPFQYVELAINCGILVGVAGVFSLLIHQVMSFLRPALRKSEYKTVIAMLPLSVVLFIFGFLYGAFMMRYVVVIFYERSLELDIGNYLDISRLLSQILITSTLMGVAFQFPIVLTVLLKFKVIKYKMLVKQRIIAYSSSIVFAALLPPTDLISLAFLALPLIVFFEATLLLNKYIFKTHKSKKKEVK